jgi:hypothetical protein
VIPPNLCCSSLRTSHSAGTVTLPTDPHSGRSLRRGGDRVYFNGLRDTGQLHDTFPQPGAADHRYARRTPLTIDVYRSTMISESQVACCPVTFHRYE